MQHDCYEHQWKRTSVTSKSAMYWNGFPFHSVGLKIPQPLLLANRKSMQYLGTTMVPVCEPKFRSTFTVRSISLLRLTSSLRIGVLKCRIIPFKCGFSSWKSNLWPLHWPLHAILKLQSKRYIKCNIYIYIKTNTQHKLFNRNQKIKGLTS